MSKTQRTTFVASLILLLARGVWSVDTLSLEEALATAMSQSPDMVQAELDLTRSKAGYEAYKSSQRLSATLFLTPMSYSDDLVFDDFQNVWNNSRNTQSSGRLSLSQPLRWTDGTFSLSDQFSWTESFSDRSSLGEQTNFSHRFSLNYSQPIFTYNRNKETLRQQKVSLETSTLNYAMNRLSMEKSVASAFYGLYQSQKSHEIAMEELENQKKSHAIMVNKIEAGLEARGDLYQANLNLASSEMGLKNREVSYRNTLDSFMQQHSYMLHEVFN